MRRIGLHRLTAEPSFGIRSGRATTVIGVRVQRTRGPSTLGALAHGNPPVKRVDGRISTSILLGHLQQDAPTPTAFPALISPSLVAARPSMGLSFYTDPLPFSSHLAVSRRTGLSQVACHLGSSLLDPQPARLVTNHYQSTCHFRLVETLHLATTSNPAADPHFLRWYGVHVQENRRCGLSRTSDCVGGAWPKHRPRTKELRYQVSDGTAIRDDGSPLQPYGQMMGSDFPPDTV